MSKAVGNVEVDMEDVDFNDVEAEDIEATTETEDEAPAKSKKATKTAKSGKKAAAPAKTTKTTKTATKKAAPAKAANPAKTEKKAAKVKADKSKGTRIAKSSEKIDPKEAKAQGLIKLDDKGRVGSPDERVLRGLGLVRLVQRHWLMFAPAVE